MPRKIGYNARLDNIYAEAAYIDAQLEAYAITRPLRPRLEAFFGQWQEVNNEELGLIRADARADAQVDRVDADLDPAVYDLSKVLLLEVRDNRKHPLYQRYFGKQRPSAIIRPVLGPELETIRSWIPSLTEAQQESLRNLSGRFQPLVTEADGAVSAQQEVARQWTDFSQIGSRCKLVDDFNLLRRTLHADLSKLPGTPEGQNLPSDFADRFFIKERRTYLAPAEPTVAQVEARLAALRQETAEQEALLERLRQELRTREAADERRRTDEAALAEAERVAKELRAKLGK